MRDKSASVRVIEYAEMEATLPGVLPFVALESNPDVLICALGFESRTNALSAQMSETGTPTNPRGRLAVYCEYRTNNADNSVNREPLLAFLSTNFDRTLPAPADDPAQLRALLVQQIAAIVPEVGFVLTVAVDISAASGNLILTVFAVLAEIAKTRQVSVQVVYAEAQSYFPTQADYTSRGEEFVRQACASGNSTSLHEYGVEDVEVNELYPGAPQEGRDDLILAIPAYRTERLSRCLKRLSNEPILQVGERIHWILGDPPDPALGFRLEFQKRVVNRLMQGDGESVLSASTLSADNMSVTSTLDYRQSLRRIIELVDAHIGKSLALVHMGSKMQGLGAALALAVRSEVTVCYARPTSFNPERYSGGIGAMWRVHFHDFGQVLRQLGMIGTLQMTTSIEGRSGLPNH